MDNELCRFQLSLKERKDYASIIEQNVMLLSNVKKLKKTIKVISVLLEEENISNKASILASIDLLVDQVEQDLLCIKT